ncbi:hypothetical protein [Ruegeria sp. Ofav3-42]|uniref:hypothetical protein n=1 Tax=Ruegeria sp. Ofav3-42 TaxID=2917759 RepID=UPI001EF5F960|nr:hypothetical protein [Ruegeria sp. Ofav3-42]MCG7520525.1 hypothetical protein [Ruegeria sp. Ofav3-42]
MRGTTAALAALFLMSVPAASNEIQVVDDPGGRIVDRMVQIEIANKTNAQFQIIGEYCHSSCTMLLGADDVCISPDTMFGFHGPHRFKRVKMTVDEFDRQSASLSRYYPHPIRNWFMSKARFAGPDELLFVSGEYLIGLGIKECV